MFALSSDKTIATLAKIVQQELLPPTIDESQENDKDPLPTVVSLDAVEKAIHSVATRVNWGIDNGVAVCLSLSTYIVPIAHEHLGGLRMEVGSERPLVASKTNPRQGRIAVPRTGRGELFACRLC